MTKKEKKKANPKNMKKTTKKGAYKKAQKKQMSVRRAPIVESKKDERYEWSGKTYHNTPGGSPATWIDNLVFRDLPVGDNPYSLDPPKPNYCISDCPQTYMFRTQGLGETDMVGQSIFIKYLKMKFEFKLPEDNGLIHFPQCQMYLVHGFIEKSLDANENTVPTLTNLTRADINAHIQSQVNEYFQNAKEPLRFQPKGRNFTTVKILGKKEVKFNKAKSILPDPVRTGATATDQWGSLPTKIVDCEWPMMKKVRYENLPQGTASGNPGSRAANFFVNHTDSLPFWAIYVPGSENLIYSSAINRIKVRYNDVCYYTDS